MRDTDIVADPSDLRRYRTELPNIICDMSLTPYELALYVHLKRTAGAGRTGHSRKSTNTLAAESGMSVGQVIDAKKSLAEKGLIRITKRVQGETDLIMIEDIWHQNFAKFAKPSSPSEPDDTAHTVNSTAHRVSDNRSYSERKNKQIMKKEPNEEITLFDPPAASLALAAPGEIKPEEIPESLAYPEFRKCLFAVLDRLTGKIPDGAAQGKAIKWLYEAKYSPRDCLLCLQQLLLERNDPNHWRDGRVSWLLVMNQIGNWKQAQQNPVSLPKKESRYETRSDRNVRNLNETFQQFSDPNFGVHNPTIAPSPWLRKYLRRGL